MKKTNGQERRIRKKNIYILLVISAILIGHFALQMSFIENQNREIVESFGETQPRRPANLREVRLKTRTLRQHREDAALVENVDLILPDHVVDRRETIPVTHQCRSQTRDPVLQDAASCEAGSGMATAKPARIRGFFCSGDAAFTARPTGGASQ